MNTVSPNESILECSYSGRSSRVDLLPPDFGGTVWNLTNSSGFSDPATSDFQQPLSWREPCTLTLSHPQTVTVVLFISLQPHYVNPAPLMGGRTHPTLAFRPDVLTVYTTEEHVWCWEQGSNLRISSVSERGLNQLGHPSIIFE